LGIDFFFFFFFFEVPEVPEVSPNNQRGPSGQSGEEDLRKGEKIPDVKDSEAKKLPEVKKLDDWTHKELREFFLAQGIPEENLKTNYFDGRAASLINSADMLESKMGYEWGVSASIFKLLTGLLSFTI